jgi:hypothetical protein
MVCGESGSGSSVKEGQGGGGDDDDKAQPEPAPSFIKALNAFETMTAFTYAHIITDRDQANTVRTESVFFNLKKERCQ